MSPRAVARPSAIIHIGNANCRLIYAGGLLKARAAAALACTSECFTSTPSYVSDVSGQRFQRAGLNPGKGHFKLRKSPPLMLNALQFKPVFPPFQGDIYSCRATRWRQRLALLHEVRGSDSKTATFLFAVCVPWMCFCIKCINDIQGKDLQLLVKFCLSDTVTDKDQQRHLQAALKKVHWKRKNADWYPWTRLSLMYHW